MSPDEENIINVPKPHERLKLFSLLLLTLHLNHKQCVHNKEGVDLTAIAFPEIADALYPKIESSCF